MQLAVPEIIEGHIPLCSNSQANCVSITAPAERVTMAKSRKTSSTEVDSRPDGQPSTSLPSRPSPSHVASPSSATVKKPTRPTTLASQPQPQPSTSALIICRNKHWRYISSFHGPWLQMPPEILEIIANANYNTPRPHPVDPAVFFDLVKIRHLVEDATTLSVRAATGVASAQAMSNSSLGLGFGQSGGGGMGKLSRERKHRMREQASQKLAKAYRLDEIACSVATMQSASSLEDVASLVLQRNKDDPDAKYVHFFHEKIPSRQLAECTSLDALSEIMASRPADAEPLRTRATVRIFKEDYEGAALDLTAALQVYRFHHPSSSHNEPQEVVANGNNGLPQRNGRKDSVIPREEEQPGSLEQQVLFLRGGVYLTLACKYVPAALLPTSSSEVAGESPTEEHRSLLTSLSEPTATSDADKQVMEARNLVRSYARKALRDYLAYLAHFDYSPDAPTEAAEDFSRRVSHAVHGLRIPRSSRTESSGRDRRSEGSVAPHKVYRLSELFAATQPAGLAPYPRSDLVATKPGRPPPSQSEPEATSESLTYHPLLTEALHSLLLCHCLAQTSAKELQRHASMVARLARLADGYPVFQASRSPARADWVEVLRQGENWIHLPGTWEALCAPAPFPNSQPSQPSLPLNPNHRALMSGSDSDLMGVKAKRSGKPRMETEKEREERIHHQAMLAALNDERVTDMESLRAAVRAHKKRNQEDERLLAQGLEPEMGQSATSDERAGDDTEKETLPDSSDAALTPSTFTNSDKNTLSKLKQAKPQAAQQKSQRLQIPKRWTVDNGREYPTLTERAAAVARWVVEAPFVASDGARKKKKKKPTNKAGNAPPAAG